jgi:predicted nucleic acid-binding protein
LLEIGDALANRKTRRIAQGIIENLRRSPSTTILPAAAAQLARGQTLFDQAHDKDWSLTDCISFAMMREHEIGDALTHDHHFDQAGFRALLRVDPPAN